MSDLDKNLSNITKVLVTGLTGFVGTNLRTYLKEDFLIQGISRKTSEGLISYRDLKKSLLNESKAFIHLAGKAHDLKKTSDDSEYFKANTELTKKLFDQFLESDCQVFIYMSSVKAVTDEVETVLTEDAQPNPLTAYGKSKLAAERYILDKKLTKDKRVYILRPCMIHGPNNKGNLNLLYSFISKGMPYPFGRYENKRSFLSVHNLCFVIEELIKNKDVRSGVYNIADNQSISAKELVMNIGEAINKKVIIFNTPKIIINFLGKIGNIIPFPINTEKIHKLTSNYVVSNKKIKQALGKKMPLAVEKGIQLTIKSFNI
ncbi:MULTISPECIES: NAD-dependent epimerase/dehydratase family protein [unclassified Tenacibaculum]|uniref:NAD-dependent epimerase/dehydratase family protein n=1 Tax=unclassified Tenacibaculum TaxID=2635139 RepID=UPI001F4619E0|nr:MULTISPECIES: NAD-dependent epimerase/dehydratase family protein [unclassified Tenacibaculum]MCF2876599.1 NAD-dependent epimerase/dehydratase family protein [Tenacibaculum sp. Cn5-1]MCF2936750.1 NAD-dependent epimerase/dehydratase family protein [Tenacibaculum sp. Cn5-34]MCG7512974.1 NAD-dependent epimerase/dehydratase family protein [Tenacibaculum sp. Cn5-46]